MTGDDRPRREIRLESGDLGEIGEGLLAVGLTRDDGKPRGPAATADAWLDGALSAAIRRGAFRGKRGQTAYFATGEGRPDVLAVGLGGVPEEGLPVDRVREAAGLAIRTARRRRLEPATIAVPPRLAGSGEDAVEAAAEGLVLGDWSYEELLGEEGREERGRPPALGVVHVAGPGADPTPSNARAAADRGRRIGEAQNWARGLVVRPGNVATPDYLGRRVEELGDEVGLDVEVWGPERLRTEGFGALLAVARGSDEEPRFLILRHEGGAAPDEAPYVLVGKGVTFDSGGISLKPSKGMEDMKYDMAGAAAVLGTMRAVAELALPRRVVGLVPAAENLPSGRALKPADVIRGVSGKSIEVINTDAEGRLLLSDALAYGTGLEPRAMVDLATLTGACVVALGSRAAGLMSRDDDLAEELLAASERSGERIWRLPLWAAYRSQMDSAIADIRNSGGREAGAVTAGIFLREFVGETRWAHLDIAGTAWADEEEPYQPEGATGFGVRLLVDWLRNAE